MVNAIIIYYPSRVEEKKFGELRSTNTRDYAAVTYPAWVDNAHSAYANAFDFGACDFANSGISAA